MPDHSDNTSSTHHTDLDGLDVMEAIQAHLRWKKRLGDYIAGTSSEQLDAEAVSADHNCTLGQWIHGVGERTHGNSEIFLRLRNTHAEFHRSAGDIIRAADAGQKEEASRLLNTGDYPKFSHQVKAELARLSLEAEAD